MNRRKINATQNSRRKGIAKNKRRFRKFAGHECEQRGAETKNAAPLGASCAREAAFF
jgi:hypothetical protein